MPDDTFVETLLFELGIKFNLKTDNPRVNWRIDNYFNDSFIPYDDDLYTHEIGAWKKSGGKILSVSWK